MKISVIIPSFNEALTLPTVIHKVLAIKLSHEKEIIVIDDGSTDDTSQFLKQLVKDKKVKVFVNRQNLGKGGSIIRVLKKATGDIFLIQDADLEYDPCDIPRLLKPFDDQNVTVVYGSRVLGNNPISHWTFNLGGRLVTLITNLLFGTHLTDEPTGYKVFRKKILERLNLKAKGFEFCPEVTAKIAKAGIKITEVPISYQPRPVSQKKIKWHDGLFAIYCLIKYRFFD